MAVPKISKISARVNMSKSERAVNDALKVSPPKEAFWDEAEQFYQDALANIEKTHGMLSIHLKTVMADPEQRAQIADKAKLTNSVNMLNRDIEQHAKTIAQIHERHNGRTGGITNSDDHMLLLTVNGEYHDAMNMYHTITMPIVTDILSQTGVVDDLVSQAITQEVKRQHDLQDARLEEIQDPNVITDVVIKNV